MTEKDNLFNMLAYGKYYHRTTFLNTVKIKRYFKSLFLALIGKPEYRMPKHKGDGRSCTGEFV